MTGGWIRACTVAELPPGQAIAIETEPPVAVFNTGDGFYATDDTCTHEESSLAEGYLDGDVIECPFHMATFCVRTGKVLSPPATEPLRTYPTRTADGAVWIHLGGPDLTDRAE